MRLLCSRFIAPALLVFSALAAFSLAHPIERSKFERHLLPRSEPSPPSALDARAVDTQYHNGRLEPRSPRPRMADVHGGTITYLVRRKWKGFRKMFAGLKTIGDGFKSIGSGIKDVAKDTGKAIAKPFVAVGHGVKKAAVVTGVALVGAGLAVGYGLDKAKDGIKKGYDTTAKYTAAAAHKVGDSFKEGGKAFARPWQQGWGAVKHA